MATEVEPPVSGRESLIKIQDEEFLRDHIEARDYTSYLYVFDIFNEEEMESVDAIPEFSKRNERFLKLLSEKGRRGYRVFKKGLAKRGFLDLKILHQHQETKDELSIGHTIVDRAWRETIEQKDEQQILNHFDYLVRKIEASNLTSFLATKNVIDGHDMNSIDTLPQPLRNKEFLRIICCRGSRAFMWFVEGLRMRGNGRLCNLLLGRPITASTNLPSDSDDTDTDDSDDTLIKENDESIEHSYRRESVHTSKSIRSNEESNTKEIADTTENVESDIEKGTESDCDKKEDSGPDCIRKESAGSKRSGSAEKERKRSAGSVKRGSVQSNRTDSQQSNRKESDGSNKSGSVQSNRTESQHSNRKESAESNKRDSVQSNRTDSQKSNRKESAGSNKRGSVKSNRTDSQQSDRKESAGSNKRGSVQSNMTDSQQSNSKESAGSNSDSNSSKRGESEQSNRREGRQSTRGETPQSNTSRTGSAQSSQRGSQASNKSLPNDAENDNRDQEHGDESESHNVKAKKREQNNDSLDNEENIDLTTEGTEENERKAESKIKNNKAESDEDLPPLSPYQKITPRKISREPIISAHAMRLKQRQFLLEDAIEANNVAPKMAGQGIIDKFDVETIRALRDDHQRVRELVSLVSWGGSKAYDLFLEALDEADYSRVRQVLTSDNDTDIETLAELNKRNKNVDQLVPQIPSIIIDNASTVQDSDSEDNFVDCGVSSRKASRGSSRSEGSSPRSEVATPKSNLSGRKSKTHSQDNGTPNHKSEVSSDKHDISGRSSSRNKNSTNRKAY